MHGQNGAAAARSLLVSVPTMRKLVFLGLLAAACSESLDPADYRCRLDLPDGGCLSMPANCPVTHPHADTPSCPSGTLIKVSDDQCAVKVICVD